jgi:predicted TIM-barrel fold metal-dependent hydrolase
VISGPGNGGCHEVAINAPNLWRLETPGHTGWQRTAHADDPKKYFMVSTDSHANEPADLWAKRLPPEYRDRAPRIITDEKGVQWRYCEGYRPDRVRVMSFEGEDWRRAQAGAEPAQRVRDNRADGVDMEIIFPNKGLAMWATPDPVFSNAQCRVWNDWAWEQFGPYPDAMLPVAAIATGDLDGAMAEIERVAKL